MSPLNHLSIFIKRLIGGPRRHFIISAGCLMVLCASLTISRIANVEAGKVATPQPAPQAPPALQGEPAIEHLKEQGTYNSLAEAMAAVKYQASWQPRPRLENIGAAYELNNAANNLLAYVNGDGLQVTSLSDARKSWRLGLQLKAYGYGKALTALSSGEVTAKEARVEIKRNSVLSPQSSALTEWFVNTSRGIEHGFTINGRPTSDPRPLTPDPLRLQLAVTGDLRGEVNSEGSSATFKREADNLLVSYEKLMVMDAKGRAVKARMQLEGRALVIEVDDAVAEYPLTIDPLFRELTKLTASDGAALNRFGNAVAISGDTVVVGADQHGVGANTFQGSAYVFVRSGVSWTQQQQLTAADGEANDHFGSSVAISGDTVVVGALADDAGNNLDQGSAYVFVRSGTSWTQQAKLIASDGASNDTFGRAVDISGDTLVVGADGVNGANTFDQGAAYVFVRSGVSWAQQAKLTASDGAGGDNFGGSVGISGNTVVVAAAEDDVGTNGSQGSAYVFVRNGMTWTQQQQLLASDGEANDSFGYAVAISGDTVVVGAIFGTVGGTNQGSAYVFVRSDMTWTQQQKLVGGFSGDTGNFGRSVAISGDTVLVGAFAQDLGPGGQQAVYVFMRNGLSWTQQAQLTASDDAAGFSLAVAISGDTVVVGAPADNNNQGSAYLFVCNWTQQPQLTASDGASPDNFGVSVALSNDTAVIGAMRNTVTASQQGAVYVFIRIGSSWTFQAKLIASPAAASDLFGNAVAISGDTIVVGVSFDDVGANSNQGSAYVFVRSGVSWTQQQQLLASDGAGGDNFGNTVAISGDTVVVGALSDDVGANLNQGSAYVFTRNGTTWTQQQKLTASDGAASDIFGTAVAISGDTLVISATADDVGANGDQGSAYAFTRTGTTWSEQQKLLAADGAASDNFGSIASISGDVIAVGAPLDNVGANSDQGSAYIFTRSGTIWTQQQQLTASDGAANDRFGIAIANSGDAIVVGARLDDIGANADQGSAYVFMRSGASWYEQQHLTASNGAASDDYGVSVAINGNTILIGADFDDVAANANQGSAYIYFLGCNTVPTAAINNLTRQKGSASASATIANVNDSEDPIGYLSVTVSSAPVGIAITGITNSNGVITAQIAAACNATLGNNAIVLQVQDSDGGVTTATMFINVTANTLPMIGAYNDTSVLATNSTTIIPSIAPGDNGSIIEFSATSPTFAGILGADPDSGNITIANARPAGAHIITVTAIDNCGATISSGFILTVTCQSITVNPASIPAGTAGSNYNQVFTQTGGIAPVTFSLSGTLPTGLSFAAGTATLAGTPTQVGSYPITITATDRNNCAGSRNYTLTINAPLLVWNGSTSNDWHTAANWTPNAVPTTFHDVLIPSSSVTNEPTIGASSSAINAMTMQSGRTLTINATRQLSTASDVTTTGIISGAGTLVFDGATFTQNGAVSVASVQFDAGTHALTGGGSFASNIITVLNGASVNLTSNHSVSVIVINSGGTFDATNQTLTLSGAGTPIFNSGTFTATGSTIIYQGSVAQVVTANIAYNNLTINNPAGVSLAGDTTASGVLNLLTDLTTGAFTLTMPNTGSSTGIGDVIGNTRRTGFALGSPLSFGSPFNTLRFDSGTVPTDMNINLVKTAPAGFPANTVTRTYTITPNGGSGYSATLRLRYKDTELNGVNESSLELWRYNGASWVSPAGTATRDTTNNWVEETAVTAFSPWAIAGPVGPTLVELISCTVIEYDQGTLVEWQTGLEVDNLGFNVYREADGKRQLLNQQLVAGSALRASSTLLTGERYALFDAQTGSAKSNAAYWLEDLDLAGHSTWHGPFYAKYAGGPPPARGRVEGLNTVGKVQAESLNSGEVERVAAPLAMSRATSQQLFTQTALANQPAAKIFINREGWYRVTQAQLLATGIASEADPQRLRMFVDGEEIAIYVSTNKDGGFDEHSFVEFYGLGLDTPSTATRVYWLVEGDRPGKRITQSKGEGVSSSSVSFRQTVERRDRTLYFAALLNGEAENFFGAVITSQGVEQSLRLRHLLNNAAPPASVEVKLQGVTRQAHQVQVQLNGQTLGSLHFAGQANEVAQFSVPHTLLQEGANVIRLSSQNGAGDVSVVEAIRVSFQHRWEAEDNRLRFAVAGKELVTLSGFTTKAIRVFDVTEANAPQELLGKIEPAKDETFAISVAATQNGERTILALADDRTDQPVTLKANQPSDLKPAMGADFVVITKREFFAALAPLQLKRESEGLRTRLVDIEDLDDEFNFGQKSPQALKDFLAYTQTSWRVKPRFVLLAGDASYDAKNYLGFGDNDVVPTKLIDTSYMETASDEWFVDFNRDGIGELSLGRLPVRSVEEVGAVVRKLLSVDASQSVDVSRSVTAALLVSDANEGFDFEAASRELKRLLDGQLTVAELQRGRLDAETAKRELTERLRQGMNLVNYVGHGAANSWRGNLLTADDARELTNERLPLFVLMTCLNAYFDDAAVDSLGESLLKNPSGGAVAVWASSGVTQPYEQALMNQAFYRELVKTTDKKATPAAAARLGDVIRQAKAATADIDIRRTWILLGDPAMRLERR